MQSNCHTVICSHLECAPKLSNIITITDLHAPEFYYDRVSRSRDETKVTT